MCTYTMVSLPEIFRILVNRMRKLQTKRREKCESRINDTVTQSAMRSNCGPTCHDVTTPNASSSTSPMASTRRTDPNREVKVEEDPHIQFTRDSGISDKIPLQERTHSRSFMNAAPTAVPGSVKEEQVPGTRQIYLILTPSHLNIHSPIERWWWCTQAVDTHLCGISTPPGPS